MSTSFDRAEIFYEVVLKDVLPDGGSAYAHLLRRLRGKHAHQCGIVFAGTRDGTTQLAHSLAADGISAAAYHAGLGKAERATAQRRWMDGEVLVMVATVAFGMGIDKVARRHALRTLSTRGPNHGGWGGTPVAAHQRPHDPPTCAR